MNKKLSFSLPVLVLIIIGSFLAGTIWQKSGIDYSIPQTAVEKTTQNIRFQPEKSPTPIIEIYLRSFGQKDKLLTANLKKTAQFFGDLVVWQPHYLFHQTEKPVDPDQCLATEEGLYFCSDLGRQQLNQNVRELCAWVLADNKLNWWEFINANYQNCSLDEIDGCWQNQAREYNLPVEEIQDCFSTKAVEIIKDQIKVNNRRKINYTPVVYINNLKLPPNDYSDENKMTVKVENEYFQRQEINSPEYFITTICASFDQPPEICGK